MLAVAALVSGCIEDLGVPPGFTETVAVDVTADGTVLGTGTAADGHREAFLRSPEGEWTLLGAEAPGAPDVWSEAAAVNATGTVVGTSSDGGDVFTERAFSWTEAGAFQSVPVDVPGYPHSTATDVNGGGQVVGRVFDATTSGPGFLYTPGAGTTVLSSGVYQFAFPFAVNESGTVVGQLWQPGSGGGVSRAVVWAPPAYEPVILPSPATGGPWSILAVAVDDDGTIAGTFNGVLAGQANSTVIGLVWSPAAGHPYTERVGLSVYDIEDGTLVGTVSSSGDPRAAVWPAGEPAPEQLGTLPGQARSWATDITGDHIVGYAPGPDGYRAARYTPAP